jgi:hypothetical protein
MSIHRSRPAPLTLDFDAEAAEEKALVRLRQASVAAPENLYVLRSGGAVLEAIAFGIFGIALVWGGITMFGGGTGEILDTPRGIVVFGVLLAATVVSLFIGIAGQLLVAQAAVARNTRLTTAILAELNHTLTATMATGDRRPSVGVSIVPAPVESSVPA